MVSTHAEATLQITLTIDDDVLAAAQQIANCENKSLGEVISALARQGLARNSRESGNKRNGIPLLRYGGSLVTSEFLNQLRDELP